MFIFGVFTGYDSKDASILEMTTNKIQELGILSDTEDENKEYQKHDGEEDSI